jgi:acetylserotonin N-methyltransferase
MSNYEPPSTNDQQIWELWLTNTYQGVIVTADDMQLFTSLAEEPASIPELAQRLGYDERATGVLVRSLASLSLLVPHEGRFQLTEPARLYLLKSSPYYWGHMMRVGANEWHVTTLTAALKKKNSANAAGPEGTPKSTGKGRSVDGWAEGSIPLDQARDIAARMHSHSLVPAIGAARAYDFGGVNRILDVGGGSGCFMIAFAQAHARLQATIMDLPTMCKVAKSYIDKGAVTDRVDTVSVDMFRQPWPKGYDAVFFSNVWHDWNFRTCRWLAERAYEILPTGGRIMLHEMLLDDDGAGPATTASFSVLMLLATQGQQFTFEELREILEGAGFRNVESIQTSGYYSIVTGYKL